MHMSTIWMPLASVLLATLCTWAMRMLAPSVGYLDHPGAQRFHEKTTPLLGGAAIFLTLFLLGLSVKGLFGPKYVHFFLGLSALFFLGLVDDKITLSPLTKLGGQVFVALAFYFGGLRVALFEWELLNACVGIAWVVGIVNAMNLLDNIDGLCGAITLVAVVVLTGFLLALNNLPMALFGLLTAGALVGFLFQNFYNAKIFLGDAGAMLLGGLVAGLGLMCVQSGDVPSHLSITMVLAMPILDTSLVTFHRLKNGQHVMQGGKDHLSHRLANHFGLGPTKAVLMIAAGGLVSGAAAWGVRNFVPGMAFLVWGAGLVAMIGLIAALGQSYDYGVRRKLSVVPAPVAENEQAG